MNKKNLAIWMLFSLIFLQCQEKNELGEINQSRVEKLKRSIPKLLEIDSLIKKRNENFSPDYSNWRIGNMKLQLFESNQDINLFNGYYARSIYFKPLIDGHINRYILNIKYPWMQTELELKKGKTYYIVVNGLASTSNCKTTLWIGPEGKNDLYNDLPYYSVIGRINEGKSFYIGKELEFRPENDGKLYLGYNDDLYVENIGYYVVDIFEMTRSEALEKLKEKEIKIGSYYAE